MSQPVFEHRRSVGPLEPRSVERRVMLLSVVVPCKNEEEGIQETHRRLVAALELMGAQPAPPPEHEPRTYRELTSGGRNGAVWFEVIYVDDGSTDATASILCQLQASDSCVRVVRLSRNFGHQVAITAGLEHASGDAVVVIDADLQDPPEVIGEFVAKWMDGIDVVYGVRAERAGETAFKLLSAKLFYRFIGKLSDTAIPLDTGDFRL